MRNIKSIVKKVFVIILVASIQLSCKEDLELDNLNAVDDRVIGVDLNTTQGLVNGMYAPLQSIGMHGRWLNLIYDGVSDEADTPNNQPNIDRISNYLLDGSNDPVTMSFQACYQGINRANTLLDKRSAMSFDETTNNTFIGEALFMRAHYYFVLVTLYGDVPLTLSTQDEALPQSPQVDVYTQIIEDLKEAAILLPGKGREAGRPTNESAYAYLGKAYLYRADLFNDAVDYTLADEAFGKVVSYSLTPNFIDNFNTSGEYNDESLFEVGFIEDAASEQGTWTATPEFSNNTTTAGAGVAESTFRSTEYSAWRTAQPETEFLDKFDRTDPRSSDTFFFQNEPFGTGQYTWGNRPLDAEGNDLGNFNTPSVTTNVATIKKYSNYIENDIVTVNVDGINRRVLRYADVLLMRAEAEAKKPGGSLVTAMSYVNQVRSRPSVSMPALTAADMGSFMDIIIQERIMELSYEGHRFLDLKRWGIDFDVLNAVNSNYTIDERFLPFPNSEVQSNPNLK